VHRLTSYIKFKTMGYICFIEGLQCKDDGYEPDLKRLVHTGLRGHKYEG
jgi:hypothetical protein